MQLQQAGLPVLRSAEKEPEKNAVSSHIKTSSNSKYMGVGGGGEGEGINGKECAEMCLLDHSCGENRRKELERTQKLTQTIVRVYSCLKYFIFGNCIFTKLPFSSIGILQTAGQSTQI